jgi:hypothetical protein
MANCGLGLRNQDPEMAVAGGGKPKMTNQGETATSSPYI